MHIEVELYPVHCGKALAIFYNRRSLEHAKISAESRPDET